MQNIYNRAKDFFIPDNLDEEKKRVAGILLMIAYALTFGLFIIFVSRVFTNDYHFFTGLLTAWSLFVLSIFLIHKKFLDLAANILLWSMLTFIFFMMYTNDGFHDSALITIPGVLVAAGMVLNKKYFYLIMAFCLIVVMGFCVLEVQGLLINRFSSTTIYRDALDILIILSLTGFTIRIFIQDLQQSLKSTRESEKEIQIKASLLAVSEKLLKESESLLRIFINGIESPVFLLNNAYKVVLANNNFARRKNMSVEDLEGKDVFSLYPPDLAATRRKNVSRVFETGETVIFEDSYNGNYYVNYAYPVRDEFTNNVTSVAVLALDVTSTQNPLRENKLLAQTLKSVKDAVSITDNNDDVIFVNEAFISAYGYSEEEIIGKKISLVRPYFTSEVMSEIIHGETLRGGWHGEVLNHRKNGEHFVVELWTSIVKDKEGHRIGTVGVARDISERKKAEKELIEAKEKAEEMSRLKSNFLSNMSHELRTPLVGILGFAEILEDEMANPDHKEMINKIIQGAGRLSTTLNQILDLSKVETNKNTIELEKINLTYKLSEVFNFYLPLAVKKNLLMKLTEPEAELFVLGDDRMVFNIFNNLINNAVKYTATGRITVSSSVETIESSNYCVVKIIDTGIGIPEDKLGIIFEEFRQASEGLNRGYEGTGLGLTLCNKFVTMLNGTIHVESKPGEGSTFTVTLPLYTDPS